jgi:hypothetical protein
VKKSLFVLGLAIVLTTTAVFAAGPLIQWNDKPSTNDFGISDYQGLISWAVLNGYNTHIKFESGWRALNRRYQKYLDSCDWEQPATEFRAARIFDGNGWRDNDGVCYAMPLYKSHKPVKRIVDTFPIVDVVENETESNSEINETEEVTEEGEDVVFNSPIVE